MAIKCQIELKGMRLELEQDLTMRFPVDDLSFVSRNH